VVEGKAMRKEEPEEEMAQAMGARVSPEEVELSDEDLLGEATLAKISRTITIEDDSDIDELAEELSEELSEEEEQAEDEEVEFEDVDTEEDEDEE
jgi:hypothetical protein